MDSGIQGISNDSNIVSILAAQVPDEPTSLQDVPAITSATQIGLSWVAPVFNGGSPILDYQVWSDEASGATFTLFAENVVETSYTATGLTQGQTY